MIKRIFIIYLILLCNIIIAQEETSFFKKVDSLYLEKKYLEIIKSQKKITTTNISLLAKYNFTLAKAFENLNKEDSAFIHYNESLKLYKDINYKENIAEINNEIYLLLDSKKKLNANKDFYLRELYKYANETKSNKWLTRYFINLSVASLKNKAPDSVKHYINKAKRTSESLKTSESKIDIYNLLGTLHSRDYKSYKNYDSALHYYNKALVLYFSDTLRNKNLNTKFKLLNNIGNTYRRKKDYIKALNYYDQAEKIDLLKLNLKSKEILYRNIDSTYYYLQNWKKAYEYSSKYNSVQKIIDEKKQNITISKYDNEKLRADNLEIESKRKQSQNFLIGALAFILFGGITALLLYKNTRRKQKLAEQEKILETQKLATVLKEQELMSIDAMIEGQEKERQRIANDLHDDLGGLMATVKLHFNALKDKQTPELFDKTTHLLDEAYQKIRSIAHAKNSGVIAKQGLLKAINNMADKISSSNKISIHVMDYGLENRLENSLELTIFRIIQELVTNILKHADATEATIHLTNHKESLNIMVEDNGTGFNPSQITTKNKGMGISSIDKRVAYLEGTMAIESDEVNKGTTIIIDIPI